MEGNGTIALEILEDLPEPDAVLVPFGGGGLLTGISRALAALRPETRVYAVEPETAAAVRLLAERTRIVAEGAGALVPAAALAGRAGEGRIVCVVPGGNIDASTLAPILVGETP